MRVRRIDRLRGDRGPQFGDGLVILAQVKV